MALLQISEPGASPDPHQRRIAVGIDLGTTHSLVASIRHGHAECLPDEQGRILLPSAVRYLEDGGRQIGHEALAAQAQDPANTLVSFKRFMGRRLSDIQGHDKLSYDFVDHPGMLGVNSRAGEKSPVEVSADILMSLRIRAEDGTVRFIEVVATNLLDDSSVQGIVLNLRDLTATWQNVEIHPDLAGIPRVLLARRP